MPRKRRAISNRGRGRPATYDELALLAYSAPLINQGYTLAEICAHGFDFLEGPELSADGATTVYRRRRLFPETMQRQERKARARLGIDVRALARVIPEDKAQEMADQAFANATFTWGGKPRIPHGFLPFRTPQRGRPPKK